MTSTKDRSKWKIYGLIVAIFVTVSLTVMAITTFTIYPTSEHRNVAQQLAELDKQAFTSGNFTEVLDSEKYTALQSTPEASYSRTTDNISLVFKIAVEISMIVAAYYYLKRNHVTSNPVSALVGINVIAFMISVVPHVLIYSTIVGVETLVLSDEVLFGIPMLILGAMLVALYTYVIAKITNWNYNRRHGFAVE